MKVLREDEGAAERAVGVGLEPDVDAVDVEGVGAGGKETEVFVWLEVSEANRALVG